MGIVDSHRLLVTGFRGRFVKRSGAGVKKKLRFVVVAGAVVLAMNACSPSSGPSQDDQSDTSVVRKKNAALIATTLPAKPIGKPVISQTTVVAKLPTTTIKTP